MDSFKEGMIVRVYCKDFRTYTEAEFFPGAKLNMITGPNGTGKSSLVYAIVLGLGGKPTVIGSEKQLSSYVRRGCRTAEIQIELYSEPSNYVIGRTFTVDNKTNWTVNGQHSTLKMVESIIKEMNIQVDNLCQFLPQDKVQDFAKMDSKQLLENTMKTVGSKEVVDLHLSLKELRKNELSLDEQTKTKREILESERKKIMRLESEVKAIKEREEILNSIKTVEKKVAWVEFDEIEVKRKEYGFWSYLIDEMEGPDAVLNYLCHTYNLHRIPVGNDLTNKMLDAIPSQMFSFFFSDTLNYMVRTSKFSGEKTSRVVKVNQSVLLAGSTNTKLIMEYNESIASENEKLARFKTSLVEIKSDQSLKEKQINGLREAKFGLEHELHNLRTSKARLQMKKQELDIFIKQNTIDIESEKMKAKAEIKRLVMEMSDKQQVAKVTLSQYQNSMKTNLYEKFKLSRLQDVLKNKERESMAASKKLEDIKKMLSNLQEQLKIDERNSRTAYDKALKLTDNLSPNDARFKKKYSKAFSELPDSIDGLEKELSQLNARADCLAGRKASSLEEYDKTKKAIRHLEAQVANPELKLQELRQEMQEKKEAWLPQVEELTNRINKKFSQFFAQMKCVGEVSLEIPEVEDEYSKYGVCIKVQFREQGRLQQLGPHSQSGGERAVSTAIYMLALQELTTVPFRCLDEINQGMDERNERTVFDLLVKTVEKADSAQCFLLTPKILRALDYSTFVKVHCVTHSNSAIEKHFDAKMLLNMMNQQNRSMTIGRSVKRKHQDSDSDSSN